MNVKVQKRIGLASIVALALTTQSCMSPKNRPYSYESLITPFSSPTVGHRRLDLEYTSLGRTNKTSYLAFDVLLDAIVSTVQAGSHLPNERATASNFFAICATTLACHGYGTSTNQPLFALGMEEHIHDCDTASTIVVSAAERLNFPVKVVAMPAHDFVRWKYSDGTHSNCEATSGKSYPDEWYYGLMRTNALHQYVYPECFQTRGELRELSRKEFLMQAQAIARMLKQQTTPATLR